jgi:hypothetical protein
MNRVAPFVISLFLLLQLAGCSRTIHERKVEDPDSIDQGSKTEIQLMGPRAKIKHTF